MSVTVSELDEGDRETWDRYIERSRHGTVFHRYAALETQARYAGASLHPLVGYVGEEPVGTFPVFEMRKGPVSLAFSPPYELGIQYLGPALLSMDSLKQRKREKRHEGFVDGCIEWIEGELDPQYLFVQTDWHYDDVRPFTWNGFDVQPQYTYVVDLEPGEEGVLGRFSQNPRRNIRNHGEEDYSADEGGEEAIEWTIRRVNERYAEQGLTPRFTPEFVVDLYNRLDDGQVRPYTLTVDGETVAGSILLEDGERAYSWQGSARPDVDIPANDLLEWHTMCEAMSRDVRTYEILGANTPRLNEWKTKFNPQPRAYYTAKRSTLGMDVAEQLYVQLRDQTRLVSKLSPGQ